jgi:AraC-like DNA-binding protein
MNQKKCRIEFRYYEKPAGTYILPKIGEGWEIHYGADTRDTLHYHNLFEFGYCYHGGGLLVIGDQRHHYSDDCFTAIPANIPHTTESDPGRICKWEFLFVDMNAFIEEQMGDLRMSAAEIERIVNAHGTMKTMEHHRRLGVLIRLMIEECRNQEAHYEESLRGYLRATVIELLRLSEERAMRFRGTSHERYIESALEYIDKHYQEDLRIEDLANVCGLSESHFRRAFEESTNMRPIEYLNMVRVNRACRFLLMEDLSMTDVAYRTGFQTASSFNRNFKRITGSTPLQWKLKALRDGSMKQRFHISAMKGWEAEEWKDRRGPGKENLD